MPPHVGHELTAPGRGVTRPPAAQRTRVEEHLREIGPVVRGEARSSGSRQVRGRRCPAGWAANTVEPPTWRTVNTERAHAAPVPRAERTRSVPADAEAVFDVVTDLEHLSSWLPEGVEVERCGAHVVRLWVRGGIVERRLAVDWANLSVTWGDPVSPACTGVLRVLRLSPGRCAVSACLTGPAGLPAPRLDDWLVRALDALAARANGLVGERSRPVPA
ncbi:SRPBCC family protein [Saccharothrix longispora]|uniref:SRPBCC family protein n=1 Tax=Saccharothrix longispora TaxID=33920 RepID=UPI0031E5D42B